MGQRNEIQQSQIANVNTDRFDAGELFVASLVGEGDAAIYYYTMMMPMKTNATAATKRMGGFSSG
jgi:hypothetical protein